MVRFGGGMDTPEEHAHFGTIDVLTGYCACVALGAALLRLEDTGKGGRARAALAAAGNLIQAQLMYDFDTRAPFDEPSGRAALGWGPFYHCYRAQDGWMFFAAPADRQEALRRVPELQDLADLSEAALPQALSDRFATRPAAHWAAALAGSSSTVMPLGSLHDTRDASLQPESAGQIDLTQATFSVIRHDRHPMGRWCDLVAPNAVRPEQAAIRIPGPMQKYGAATRAVLGGLGYSTDKIDAMIDSGAAGESWSDKYLPE